MLVDLVVDASTFLVVPVEGFPIKAGARRNETTGLVGRVYEPLQRVARDIRYHLQIVWVDAIDPALNHR